ncbi:RNA-binding protein [Patescibacteria group bacterium]|nr:RNA-binding protein [Patescibacteria group bacterium]
MNHQMKLNPEAYESIKSGTKNLEIRLYDEKRQQIALKDTITFSKLPILDETITKKVVGLVVFSNFIELFKNVDGTKAGWKSDDPSEKMALDMEKYYSKDDQTTYGVIGIFLEDID